MPASAGKTNIRGISTYVVGKTFTLFSNPSIEAIKIHETTILLAIYENL